MAIPRKLRTIVDQSKAMAARLVRRSPPKEPEGLEEILRSNDITAIAGLLKGRLGAATRAGIVKTLGRRIATARERAGIPYPLSPELLKTALRVLWKHNRQRALKTAVSRLTKTGSCRIVAADFLSKAGPQGVKCLAGFLLQNWDDSEWSRRLADLLAARPFNAALAGYRDILPIRPPRHFPKGLYSLMVRTAALICDLGERELSQSIPVHRRRAHCNDLLDELFRSEHLHKYDVDQVVKTIRKFEWTDWLVRVRHLLGHRQEGVREAACHLLVDHGDHNDIALLAAALPGLDKTRGGVARALLRLVKRLAPTGKPCVKLRAEQAQLTIASLEPLLQGSAGQEQAEVLELLRAIGPFNWRAHIQSLCGSRVPGVRRAAWDILAELGEPSDLEIILAHLRCRFADDGAVKAVVAIGQRELDRLKQRRVANPHDSSVTVQSLIALLGTPVEAGRTSGVRALAQLGWPGWKAEALALLRSGNREAIMWTVKALGDSNDPTYVSTALEQLRHKDPAVRHAALEAATKLAPQRQAEFAKRMLTDPVGLVAERASELLGCMPEDEFMEAHLLALRRGGPEILTAIAKRAPSRLREAVLTALHGRNVQTQQAAVKWLSEHSDADAIPELVKLALNKKSGARVNAFETAIKLGGGNLPREQLLQALEASEWEIRRLAITTLVRDSDPEILEALLPRTRDEYGQIRLAALRAAALYDDPRVFSDLVSALNDPDPNVRSWAQQIFEAPPCTVPTVAQAWVSEYASKPWNVLQNRIAAAHAWAQRLGMELLGRQVEIAQFRQGLARTKVRRQSASVEIEVTDTPVTSLHPHGEEIMRGLIVHELGHHLCDVGVRGAWTMRGIARSEGVGEIYDILLDERLERIMRSRSAEWGLYLDQVASYAFAQNLHHVPVSEYAALAGLKPEEVAEAVQQGKLPGILLHAEMPAAKRKVGLTDKDILSIHGALPPLTAFLSLLRCGFNPEIHPDPKVVEAVKLVPSNLKALPHSELLKLAREIGDLIGRDKQHKRWMQRLKRFIRSRRVLGQVIEQLLQRLAEGGQIAKPVPRAPPRDEEAEPAPRLAGRPRVRLPKLPGGQCFDRGKEQTFPELTQETRLSFDPEAHAKVVASIRPHIRRLRPYLERLGRREIEEYASVRGRRVDIAQARRVICSRRPNLLVGAREEVAPDTYLGILIDRSGSMECEKIERAKAFGTLVAESAKGIKGIEGHVNAFDNVTFYVLGDFRRHTIASLRAGEGNNDSGALARAADLALASRMQHKILIMISDGAPSACTFDSLKHLVGRLTQKCGIVCAQVAVEKLPGIAFPHYVDLSAYPLSEAVTRFGKLIIQLTRRKK